MEPQTPWLSHYGDVPFHLDYPKTSMCDAVLKTASEVPDNTALSYMGRKIPYSLLAKNIELTARSFAAIGIKETNY